MDEQCSCIWRTVNSSVKRTVRRSAQPDIAKCDVFLGQHLCWPWNNIVINQSDFKNQFIIFVNFRITISVWCLYISLRLSYDYIFGLKCCSRVNKICWPRNTSNSAISGRARRSFVSHTHTHTHTHTRKERYRARESFITCRIDALYVNDILCCVFVSK